MESPKTSEKKIKRSYRIEVAGGFAKSKELEAREKQLKAILGRDVGTAGQTTTLDEDISPWEIQDIPIDELTNKEIEKLRSQGFEVIEVEETE